MSHRIEALLEQQLTVLKELRDRANDLLDLERKVHAGKMNLQWGLPVSTFQQWPSSLAPSGASQYQFKPQGETMANTGKETESQTIPCSAVETDASGNPVTIDPTNAQWAVADTTIATVSKAADGSG